MSETDTQENTVMNHLRYREMTVVENAAWLAGEDMQVVVDYVPGLGYVVNRFESMENVA